MTVHPATGLTLTCVKAPLALRHRLTTVLPTVQLIASAAAGVLARPRRV